jgi:hypothetical protein
MGKLVGTTQCFGSKSRFIRTDGFLFSGYSRFIKVIIVLCDLFLLLTGKTAIFHLSHNDQPYKLPYPGSPDLSIATVSY